jgi:hypothetical protein
MKRLFVLAIFAVAGWYGWQHRDVLLAGRTDSEAVLVNSGTRAMLRVRLTVGGQTHVREVIEPDARVEFPFSVSSASDFQLRWEWRGLEGAPEWRGGEVTPGPLRTRCTLQMFDDNAVTVSCVPMPKGPDVR